MAGGPPWLGYRSEESCCYLYGALGDAAAPAPALLQPVTCSDRDQRGSWDSSEDHGPPFLIDDQKSALALQVITSTASLKHVTGEWQPQAVFEVIALDALRITGTTSLAEQTAETWTLSQ